MPDNPTQLRQLCVNRDLSMHGECACLVTSRFPVGMHPSHAVSILHPVPCPPPCRTLPAHDRRRSTPSRDTKPTPF